MYGVAKSKNTNSKPQNKEAIRMAITTTAPTPPVDPRIQRPERVFVNADTQHLYDNGYVVVPVAGLDPEAFRRDFVDQLVCIKDSASELAFGGFSRVGTSDALHTPVVRDLRLRIHREVFVPLMDELADNPENNERRMIELVVDGVLVREPGKAPTAELWHRDESTNAAPSDIIMGGWCNLNDTESQYFSGIPGSHRVQAGDGAGGSFNSFSKSQSRNFKQLAQRIEIPPMHMLVFYQDMVHEVLAKKQKGFTQWRLFTAVRLTHQEEPLVPDILDRLDTNATVPLKSGQFNPMYARMHTNFRRNVLRLDAFTRTNLHPSLHEAYTGKFARDDPDQFGNLVKPKTVKKTNGADTRECPSLQELGLPLYAPYTPDELAYYTPYAF
jgi:hypothetical protein